MRVWVRESDLRCCEDAQEQGFGGFMLNVRLIEPDDRDGWRFVHVDVRKAKG
jgi:hypothetical protein